MIVLICGDCHDIIDSLPGFHMCLTDPPFCVSNDANVDNEWNGYTSNKGEWDKPVGVEWIDSVCDKLVGGGLFSSFGVFGSQIPIFQRLEKIGMRFQSHPVWEKSNPAPSIHRRMFTHANEILLVFSKGRKWTFNYDIAKSLNEGKQLKNVWKAGSPRRILGRTRKPLHVLDRLLLPLTCEEDVVVDPFCGTCSIVERAAFHGCEVYGIEIDPEVIEWSYTDLSEKGYEVVVEGL